MFKIGNYVSVKKPTDLFNKDDILLIQKIYFNRDSNIFNIYCIKPNTDLFICAHPSKFNLLKTPPKLAPKLTPDQHQNVKYYDNYYVIE